MPTVPRDRPEFGDLAPLTPVVPLDDQSDTGYWGTMGAAFRQSNVVASTLASHSAFVSDAVVDPDFDIWGAIKGTRYEQHWERLADVTSRRRLLAVQADIDQEERDRRTLASAGWLGTGASIVGGVADLPTMLPGGALVRAGRMGYSGVRSGLMVGAAAGVGTAVQEAGLQYTQQLRTAEETGVAIGASVVLGGLLGAGAAKLMTRREMTKALLVLDDEMQRLAADTTPDLADELEELARPGAVGAEVRTVQTVDELSVSGRAASKAARAVAWLNPMMRLMHSPSALTREVAEKMIELPVYLKKNLEGKATEPAAETLMKQATLGLADAMLQHRAIFKSMREAGVSMDRLTFRRLVGRAMRRADQVPADAQGNLMHMGIDMPDAAAPFVGQAAQLWRAKVFDPLKEQAIKLGLLPADVTVKEADSYFTRMYLTPKIIAREPTWRTVIRPHLETAVRLGSEETLKEADKRITDFLSRIQGEEKAKLTRAEELRQREQFEASLTGGTAADDVEVFSAMQLIRQGRPALPETLLQFLAKQGGLIDQGGELKAIGLTSKTRPGFIKSSRKGILNQNPKGGLTLDDAGEAAHQAGFFRDRPSVREVIDAITDDFSRLRAVVRLGDEQAVHAAEAFDELEAQLSRLGFDAKTRRLPVGTKGSDLIRAVNALLDAQSDKAAGKFNKKIIEINGEADVMKARGLLDNDLNFNQFVDEVGHSVTAKILGRASDEIELPAGVRAAARGPMKERTFHIKDVTIEDWLEDDVEMVARRYTRTMAADVELAGKFGSPNMEGVVEEINETYRALREQVENNAKLTPEKREKALTALEKRRGMDVSDVEAVRDLLRGQYKAQDQITNFARVLRVAGMWNYITKLGGALASNLTDVMRPAMVHGFGRVLGEGMPALIRNTVAIKLSVREARLAGTVAEAITHSRLATMAEVVDPYSMGSPFERFMENTATFFSYANGLTPFTDYMKAFSAVLTQNRIIGNVLDYANLAKREQDYLAFLGIDEAMAGRIRTQYAGGQGFAPKAPAPAAPGAPPARTIADMLNFDPDRWDAAAANPQPRSAANAVDLGAAREAEAAARRPAAGQGGPGPYAEWSEKTQGVDLSGVQVHGLVGEGRLLTLLRDGIDPARPLPAAAAAPSAPAAPASTFGSFEQVQVGGHGQNLDGVHVANTERWTDAEAVRTFRAAIAKDVDSIVVTAGVGDLPLFARTPIGRAVLQFKSFALASHQRTLIRGLQEGYGKFLPGMASMVMMGMFIYWLKSVERGAEVSNNPGRWVAEGLDRSGLFGLMFEANNTWEKLGGGGIYSGLQAAFQGSKRAPASRYATRSELGAAIGPSFALGEDLAAMATLPFRALSRERSGQIRGIRPPDLRPFRQNIPGASLPYWRWFIDRELMPAARESVRRD